MPTSVLLQERPELVEGLPLPKSLTALQLPFANNCQPRSKIVIAFWGDDPAGYIWYNYKERPDSVFKSARSSLYIHQIATLAEFRRKGVGRALMELALESGRDHGAEYIDLDYWVFNVEARQFFKSFGRDIEPQGNFYEVYFNKSNYWSDPNGWEWSKQKDLDISLELAESEAERFLNANK